MITIVSGGYRTGSTLAYQIARCLYAEHYEKPSYGILLGQQLKLLPPNRPAVVKSHDYDPRSLRPVNPYIIHTVRNPFDILSSLKKVKPEGLLDFQIETKLIVKRDRVFRRTDKNVLLLNYATFFGKELELVKTIGAFLGLPSHNPKGLADMLSQERVKPVADRLERGNPTLYAPRHISADPYPGNYVNHLTADEFLDIKNFLQRGDLGIDATFTGGQN